VPIPHKPELKERERAREKRLMETYKLKFYFMLC
jgi:hypothetical protein